MKWRRFFALLPGMFLALVAGCNQRSDPEHLLEHARHTFVRGELERARWEAEDGARVFSHSNPSISWKFTLLEAEALMWTGESDRVLTLLKAHSAPVSDAQTTLQMLALEGVAYAHLHRFSEAEQSLLEADKFCPSTGISCAEVKRAWGVLAIEHEQPVRAHQFFEEALALTRFHGDRFLESTALLNLGAALLRERHFDEAIDLSESAYRLANVLDAGEVAQTALGNLGWAYYQLGNLDKAQELFGQAIQRSTALGDTINHLRWLTAAGYVYLDRGEYATAERSYQEALQLAQKINSREDIFNALISLALVSEQTDKLEQADQYAERAIKMARADGNRSDEFYPLLVEGRVAAKQHDNIRAESVFREVSNDPKSDVSLKWEAEHALAKLYEGEARTSEAEREYRAALKTFETARSELKHEESALPFLTNASRIYDDYVHFLVAHGRSAEALEVADFTRARTLAEGLGLLRKGAPLTPVALNAPAIASRAGGVILFYWLGETQSYLWAINSKKTALFTLPARAEIDAAVHRYERAVVGPQDVLETANRDGIWLYTTLVAPAARMLGKNGRALIVPDGSLNGLNFETLLASGEKLHYWIEDETISDASSLRLLHSPTTAAAQRGRLLMIGNPLAAGQDYGTLPNAGLEMDKIEDHFAQRERTVYAQGEATVSSYLASKPEQFSYIHFVAHGTASRTSPLDSAVVLSPSGKQEDSFKLYARDVIGCPLRARLVTISTCYGAGTRAYTGEGLVGLSWAFLRAGAHNVVGALWEVNDTSTPQLMDRFYAELTAGQNPDIALRAAKLSLLNSKDAFRKPYYWAPFQLYSGM